MWGSCFLNCSWIMLVFDFITQSFYYKYFLFLFFSRFKLSDSNLTTQKPLGIAVLSLGTLPPLQPAYVYHCLPKALSLEGNSNGRIASRVIIQEITLGFRLGRKTPYGTKHVVKDFFLNTAFQIQSPWPVIAYLSWQIFYSWVNQNTAVTMLKGSSDMLVSACCETGKGLDRMGLSCLWWCSTCLALLCPGKEVIPNTSNCPDGLYPDFTLPPLNKKCCRIKDGKKL